MTTPNPGVGASGSSTASSVDGEALVGGWVAVSVGASVAVPVGASVAVPVGASVAVPVGGSVVGSDGVFVDVDGDSVVVGGA